MRKSWSRWLHNSVKVPSGRPHCSLNIKSAEVGHVVVVAHFTTKEVLQGGGQEEGRRGDEDQA